jgi:hypothetical protein
MTGTGGRERVDLWVAALAGPTPWLADPVPAFDRAIGSLALSASVIALLWTVQSAFPIASTFSEVNLVVFTGAWLLFSLPTVRWLLTRPTMLGVTFVTWCAVRGLLLVVALGTWVAMSGPEPLLRGIPFGAAIGAELAVTVPLLGSHWHPRRWVRSYVLSTGHLLFFIAVMAAAAIAPGPSSSAGILMFLVLDAGVLTAIAVAQGCTRLLGQAGQDRERLESQVRVREFEQRMHWMHDDVLGLLTTLRHQVSDAGLSGDALARELIDTDHQLREIQLEQGLATGSRRIFHILQPYVRRAENVGLRLIEVPSLETSGVLVDERTGRLLQRVVSCSISNAIAAGASELSIRVGGRDAAVVHIEIEDDAGGGAVLIPGRGLSELSSELGGSLSIQATQRGTKVVADIELGTGANQ